MSVRFMVSSQYKQSLVLLLERGVGGEEVILMNKIFIEIVSMVWC